MVCFRVRCFFRVIILSSLIKLLFNDLKSVFEVVELLFVINGVFCGFEKVYYEYNVIIFEDFEIKKYGIFKE